MKKNKIIWLIGVGFVLIGLIFVGLGVKISNEPQDLGKELEYVGKEDYGCYVFCDTAPSSVYYFATNLKKEDLIHYFKEASYIDRGYDSGGGGYGGLNSLLEFKTNNGNTIFYVSLYKDKDEARNAFQLKTSPEKNIIAISSSDFLVAKDALE